MSKISELSDGGSLLASDYLIVVRSGGNVKVRLTSLDVNQIDLDDNEFIRLGNSQDLTMVHNATNSIINQAGVGNLLIQKAGSTKLTVNASGIDVTGSTDSTVRVEATSGNDASLFLTEAGTGNVGAQLVYDGGDNKLYFKVGNNTDLTRMTIDRDTGSVGIGTDSPAVAFNTVSDTIWFQNAARSYGIGIYADDANSSTKIRQINSGGSVSINTGSGGANQTTFDSSGNVGIGTSLPKSLLDIASDEQSIITLSGITNNTAGALLGGINFYNADGSTNGPNNAASIKAVAATSLGADANLIFSTIRGATSGSDALEAMRLDASGNLLVGKDSLEYETTVGHIFRADGLQSSIRSGGNVVDFNRVGSLGTEEGEIIRVSSNGTTVGNIGVDSADNMYITSSATNHVGLYLGGGGVLPMNSGSLDTGDNVDIGSPNYQFADLHLAGGVVFGATGGTVTSKTLDDYEEGTFTPTFSVTNATITHDIQTGRYTKVGEIVHFQMIIGTDAVSGSISGSNVLIIGFPFTSSAETQSSSTGLAYDWASELDEPVWLIGSGSTVVTLYSNDNNATTIKGAKMATSGNSNRIYIAGSYRAA